MVEESEAEKCSETALSLAADDVFGNYLWYAFNTNVCFRGYDNVATLTFVYSFMNKCKGNINITSKADIGVERIPPIISKDASSAASERAVSEHFSAPLSSTIPRKCIARLTPSVIIFKSFPHHNDTVFMQCKLCAFYFQDAPSNQASYPGSLSDISPDPSSSIQYQKVWDYKNPQSSNPVKKNQRQRSIKQ
jgi:hypothetical protein